MAEQIGRHFGRLDHARRMASPEQAELDEKKERAFETVVLNELIETFKDRLVEADFSSEEMHAIESELAGLTFPQAAKVLCTPHETAHRKFQVLRERIDKGDIEARQVVSVLLEEAERHHFGIGYHNSPTEIKPDAQGRWFIRATEHDHRDNDLSRAYFATSYKTLYRKGTVNYLYIVRTVQDTVKTDGNWSRAGGLSVITRIPLQRIDGWVNNALKLEGEQKNKNTAQG